MKTTLAISFFGPHLDVQTCFDACCIVAELKHISASKHLVLLHPRGAPGTSQMFETIWSRPRMEKQQWKPHTSPGSFWNHCLAGRWLEFQFSLPVYGVFIIARNLTWALKYLWIACFLFLRLALALQVRFYWYYLVLSFIIDLASFCFLWLRFLFLQCTPYRDISWWQPSDSLMLKRVSLRQFYIVNLFILQDACVHLKLEEAAFRSGQLAKSFVQSTFHFGKSELSQIMWISSSSVFASFKLWGLSGFLDISDTFWISDELLKFVRPRRMVVKLLRVALHAALAQLRPLLGAQRHQNFVEFRCILKNVPLNWVEEFGKESEKQTCWNCMKLPMQQTFSRRLSVFGILEGLCCCSSVLDLHCLVLVRGDICFEFLRGVCTESVCSISLYIINIP